MKARRFKMRSVAGCGHVSIFTPWWYSRTLALRLEESWGTNAVACLDRRAVKRMIAAMEQWLKDGGK